MVAMLFLGMFYVFAPRAYAAVSLTIVNADVPPDIGTSFFNLTGKGIGDTFKVNLTVVDVADLASWQARVSWDPTELQFVSFAFPSDDVFFDKSPIRAPTDSSVPGTVLGGAAAGPGAGTFTGTGTLAVLTLRLLVVPTVGDPTPITGTIDYTALGSDTFLLDGTGTDISFTPASGSYEIDFALPGKPSFYLLPATIKPASLGDIFTVDVMVSGVSSAWEIIAFQFSIMWNTTLIEPAAPFYDNGTFLETFQYQPDGVVYAADIDAHNRPPPATPIPDGMNYTTVGALLLPDMSTFLYHAPFPSGGGKIAKLYFRAILDTVAPAEIWSSIDFIAEDFLVLTTLSTDVGYETATGAAYRAPQTVLGLSIDVYTQYPAPYGGQGGNATSDSFGPQQQVDLFALVTYNAYPVQQKLVGFQIYHQGATQGYNFAREGTTDADGMAHIAFRLPWPCNDPVNEIFGWWYVNATVEVAEQVVVDNLKFWVWWPVEVVSIEPKFTSVIQTKSGCTMDFEMVYRRYDALPVDVLLTATVYDELDFFIGSAFLFTTVSNDPVAYDVLGNPIPNDYIWDFTISIPSNAVVGKCTIYGNAFTSWPWLGGYPYCPEVQNTIDFRISAP
jgi:hypothetical protein